ncbi:unnamed protein product [Closterium sp. NIES-54]
MPGGGREGGVDAVEPVEVAVDSGAARGAEPVGAGSGGAASGGAEPGGAESGGAEPGGAESGGAEPGSAEPGGAEPAGAELGDAEPRGAESARVASRNASLRRERLSPQELHEWFARRWSCAAGAGGPPVAPGLGGARTGGTGAVGPGGAAAAAGVGPAGASGAAGAGAAGGIGAGFGPAGASGAAGAGAAGGGCAGVGPAGGPALAGGGNGASGTGAAGVGAVGVGGAADTGAATGGNGAVPVGSGGPARPRPYFAPLLEQSPLQPVSPLPAPSPYAGPTRRLAERREPAFRLASPVHTTRTSRRAPRLRPPAVPGTHQMMLRPSTAPPRVPLLSPPESSLPVLPDPESDSLRSASPTVAHLLSTVVTDPFFESTAVSALVAELVDRAARCCLDYATSLIAESESVCPPSVRGECALSTDVLEDRQEEFQCFAAALPHLVSTLIAPEGDPDAPDIPTPRSYAKAIEGPYSSQWQSAMDAEMASSNSTSTYVDEVPPPAANIVSGMWIFKVKRPPGSPPVFKARYVARGFRQRQGVDYFQTFSPTPKMTTLRVLLHVAAQRDYELHSLDFRTAFLQGSLHEDIWLRHPPGFTRSFPSGTQWSLRRPVYGLRQAPREWHDTLRTTLASLGFAPSTADPSLFLCTDTSLPPFYILVYVDDLVFATADTAGLAHMKSELQKRHTCTDLALPSDESVEPSGPYPELVGCLMYLMTCTRPDLAYPLSILARYVAPGRHRPEHMAAAKRVLRYLCSTSGLGLVLGGRRPVVLTGHADASWADDRATQRSSQVYTFSLGSGSVSWRSTRSSSVLSSSCEAEIYAGAMAAQELRWLTYLLTDLGEPPRSPPVLYVDNKAMLALCREHRLEHRTKHIALRYFLARELQQRGQLRLAYLASQANTADILTKALPPGDHQRFCTMLAMTLLRVLAFDHEGRPVQFDTWLDDLQLYLLSDSKDSVSLFDLASRAATAPPATADSSTRSQWLTRDAAARLVIRNHLPLAKCAHFRQHRTPHALYDAVFARYSSPAIAALGRLLLPYLFPELCAFATVEDLWTSDRDHFLSLDPTSLTDDLLEQHLLVAETSAVAVGAARGTPRSPFFEGCSPSPLAPSYASAGAASVSVSEDVRAASASAKRRNSKGKGGRGGGGGSGGGGGGSGTGGSGTGARRTGSGGGQRQQQQRRRETLSPQQLREWFLRGSSGGSCPIAIFDLDFDAILSAMYALSVSAEGDCYLCVPPDPGIATTALGANESGTLPGTALAEALHTFMLDCGASACFFRESTTLTHLPAPVPVWLADPSREPVVARSSTVLSCSAVPSGSLSGLHLPSFSTNLVSTAALQDAMVTTTTHGGQRVSICTCTRTGRHLATFTRRPRSSLYTLTTAPPQVAVSAQVSASGQVATSCSCRLLSHQTLLWHHRLDHPSLPRLRGMHSRLLVSGLPRSLPPLPPSPAPPCLPCVEGRQCAAPHSSFPPTTAPLQTLHIDVWSPARVSGQSHERYFLLVVDDWTRYTTVFLLQSKGQVVDVLIPWTRTVRLQLRERFGQNLPVLRLHSDRGGEFSSDLLQPPTSLEEGILQSFMLPDSPQQNGIPERRIGLVMEVTLLYASAQPLAPCLLAGDLAHTALDKGGWRCVSVPGLGVSCLVRDTSADKVSPRAIPCVFLGIVSDVPGWQFYHPTLRCILSSQDITFDESVPFYRLFPYRSTPSKPPPLFLAPGPPPVDPLPPQGHAPSGVSQVDPLPGPVPVQVAVGSGAAPGAASRGAASWGAEPGGPRSEGAEPRGAGSEGAETWGAEPGGVGSGGAEPEDVEPGGAASEGVESGGAEPQGAASSGATGAGGAGAVGAGGAGGAASTGPGGARTFGTGAAGSGGVEGAGVVGPGAGGAGDAGAGAGDTAAIDPCA